MQVPAEDAMKLYELGPTRSIRARWMLQELGVPFESVPVDLPAGEHRRDAFRALNPAGKVPVLIDEGRVLTESVAIVLYLAEKYPEAGLLPAEPAERAQAYRWMLFAVTELEQPLWRMARHRGLYPPDLRLPADIELAKRDFEPMAEVLERHLAEREFVAGDRFSAADIVVAYTLDWADNDGLLAQRPALRAYVARMYARPRAARHIRDLLQQLRASAPSQP